MYPFATINGSRIVSKRLLSPELQFFGRPAPASVKITVILRKPTVATDVKSVPNYTRREYVYQRALETRKKGGCAPSGVHWNFARGPRNNTGGSSSLLSGSFPRPPIHRGIGIKKGVQRSNQTRILSGNICEQILMIKNWIREFS